MWQGRDSPQKQSVLWWVPDYYRGLGGTVFLQASKQASIECIFGACRDCSRACCRVLLQWDVHLNHVTSSRENLESWSFMWTGATWKLQGKDEVRPFSSISVSESYAKRCICYECHQFELFWSIMLIVNRPCSVVSPTLSVILLNLNLLW
jgi:hypothetical protein